MNNRITRNELLNLIDQEPNLVLVEALPAQYFVKEHLPRAINLPLSDITAKAAEVIPEKNAAVVVYCSNSSCNNSSIAGNLLRQLGYVRVYEYYGGKQDWRDAGFAFEGEHKNA